MLLDAPQRDNEPFSFGGSFSFTQDELAGVFAAADPATETLFFQVFGPPWKKADVESRALLLAEVAKRVKAIVTGAALEPGTDVPKP